MPIYRFTASLDNTITNALKNGLQTRATGSNQGLADSLQVFSIYGQASGSDANSRTVEKSRILVQFPVGEISAARSAGTIPASGSVDFYLRMFNARHPFTVPRDFTLVAHPVSRSWDEGYGLDVDSFIDTGYCNWIAASSASSGEVDWTTEGGDFITGSVGGVTNNKHYTYKQEFTTGIEDLEMNVSNTVEDWIAGPVAGGLTLPGNYGFGVSLTSSQEGGSELRSFYNKKFYARGSQYFFKRPVVEARWEDFKTDDRGDFFLSSALAPGADNLNNLYLYNYVRGKARNIPAVGTNDILVSIYSGTTGPTGSKIGLPQGGGVASSYDLNITGTHVSTGIYSCSFAFTSSIASTEYLFDVWHSGNVEYFTGSGFTPQSLARYSNNIAEAYVLNITNLKPYYSNSEKARFRIFTRSQTWNPTIYTKATTAIEPTILRDAYYKITRQLDGLQVIDYGKDDLKYTKLSYDASGSYFDLEMVNLEAGYAYNINILSIEDGVTYEHPETFKFRVE
jgi:hypothetical protein